MVVGPTGELLVVAGVEGEHLYWFGWPPGCVRVADCEVVVVATDAEHAAAVREWLNPRDDARHGVAVRHRCPACTALGAA